MARIKVIELAEVFNLLQRVIERYVSPPCEYQAARGYYTLGWDQLTHVVGIQWRPIFVLWAR
jgi:hypothetical protein